jgi:hypothetical protein
MHEKDSLMATYQTILDKTAENIQQIEESSMPAADYALEISKRYGIDYACSLKETHKYDTYSKRSVELFKVIVEQMISSFGGLINGVVCNYIGSNSLVNVTKKNASFITKGILVNRLLTTFKLKAYIADHLKAERLSPSISLSEFYHVAKRSILLNFTVINVNQARLDFLNKNSMPNMPVWAAIVATSTLPLMYQYFEASKEWEAAGAASFYDFFVYDFFKAFGDKDKRITRYTSGNVVSSLPLELLTNNTLKKNFFGKEDL